MIGPLLLLMADAGVLQEVDMMVAMTASRAEVVGTRSSRLLGIVSRAGSIATCRTFWRHLMILVTRIGRRRLSNGAMA